MIRVMQDQHSCRRDDPTPRCIGSGTAGGLLLSIGAARVEQLKASVSDGPSAAACQSIKPDGFNPLGPTAGELEGERERTVSFSLCISELKRTVKKDASHRSVM